MPNKKANPDILKKALSNAAELKTKAHFVFDLDSTLFDVSPRLNRIIQDFSKQEHLQTDHAEPLKLLNQVKFHRTDWGIKKALERVGLSGTSHQLYEEIRDFWKFHFFSDPYLHFDHPYDGAVDFVNQLASCQAQISYLTGRDVARMGKGSAEVLKKWNFPLDQTQCQLILKPVAGMDDALFKADWFGEQLKNSQQKFWFFENEPVNINLVYERYPEVEIIFFDSTHSGTADSPHHLPWISSYLTERD